MSLLAHKVQNGEVEKEEMTAHVSTLTYVCPLLELLCIHEQISTRPSQQFIASKYSQLTSHMTRIAGGETVSTILAGITCFLLQHHEKLNLVVSEIRGAFKSYDDINAQRAQQLQYLQAVINEGLRIFPPNPQGSPRISPGFELHGRYVPEGVRYLFIAPVSAEMLTTLVG